MDFIFFDLSIFKLLGINSFKFNNDQIANNSIRESHDFIFSGFIKIFFFKSLSCLLGISLCFKIELDDGWNPINFFLMIFFCLPRIPGSLNQEVHNGSRILGFPDLIGTHSLANLFSWSEDLCLRKSVASFDDSPKL